MHPGNLSEFRGSRGGRGFTLIELMIVVAIIGILAAIAIPKFADLIRKSSEGQVKANLGAVRSALSIYYGDMEGLFPGDVYSITVSGKYLGAVPSAKIPNFHASTTIIRHNQNTNAYGCGSGYQLDTGEWIYWSEDLGCSPPAGVRAKSLGDFWVACSHTDTKSSSWSGY